VIQCADLFLGRAKIERALPIQSFERRTHTSP